MDEIKSLYIEPTSHCNLQCAMCARKNWKNESIGHMESALVKHIFKTLPDSVERVFFGGVGEPLCHPDILELIRVAKQTGRRVELITNGTLLDKEMSQNIIDTKLDMLWVSIDSMQPQSEEAAKSGAHYVNVLDNVKTFHEERNIPWNYSKSNSEQHTELGIAFVLMKSNQKDFRALLLTASRLGVREIKATHLIPYSEEHLDNICYDKIIGTDMYNPHMDMPLKVDIPIMEVAEGDEEETLQLFANPMIQYSLLGEPLTRRVNYCKFVQEGQIFIRWDGEVCPCMALLHDSVIMRHHGPRTTRFCSYGNVKQNSVQDIWENKAYAEFRERINEFNFSPCAFCGTCNLSDTNETDCIGNPFPSCGSCLWAQGIYQCP